MKMGSVNFLICTYARERGGGLVPSAGGCPVCKTHASLPDDVQAGINQGAVILTVNKTSCPEGLSDRDVNRVTLKATQWN